MKEVLGILLMFLIGLLRIAVGLYVLWYLIGAVIWSNNYPIEKMTWFIYLFVLDIWVSTYFRKVETTHDE